MKNLPNEDLTVGGRSNKRTHQKKNRGSPKIYRGNLYRSPEKEYSYVDLIDMFGRMHKATSHPESPSTTYT